MELGNETIFSRMAELARDNSNCIVSIKVMALSLIFVVLFSFSIFIFGYSLKRDSLEIKESIKEIRKETSQIERALGEIRKHHLKKKSEQSINAIKRIC